MACQKALLEGRRGLIIDVEVRHDPQRDRAQNEPANFASLHTHHPKHAEYNTRGTKPYSVFNLPMNDHVEINESITLT